MKRIIFLLSIALCLPGCNDQWNDLVHSEVVAYIKAFTVEEQVKCDILTVDKKVDILLPWYADPKAVRLTEFSITDGAVCKPAIKAGDVLDLSEPLTITLSTYDDYVWTVTATLKPKPTGDLYNMSFDLWNSEFSPYEEGADEDQRNYWMSANYLLAIFNYPVVVRETTFVASAGEGKAAMKLLTRNVTEFATIAAGTVFTGTYENFDFTAPDIKYGVPFIKRPKSLDGFACYKPQGTDDGYIFIALGEWDEPYKAGAVSAFVDGIASVPGLVGYGKLAFDKEMAGYESFSVNINYVNDHTPKYVVVIGSCSNAAPVPDSALYLDELGFSY